MDSSSAEVLGEFGEVSLPFSGEGEGGFFFLPRALNGLVDLVLNFWLFVGS